MSKELTDDQINLSFTILALLTVSLEYIDQLEANKGVFKQRLKQTANLFKGELEKSLKEFYIELDREEDNVKEFNCLLNKIEETLKHNQA